MFQLALIVGARWAYYCNGQEVVDGQPTGPVEGRRDLICLATGRIYRPNGAPDTDEKALSSLFCDTFISESGLRSVEGKGTFNRREVFNIEDVSRCGRNEDNQEPGYSEERARPMLTAEGAERSRGFGSSRGESERDLYPNESGRVIGGGRGPVPGGFADVRPTADEWEAERATPTPAQPGRRFANVPGGPAAVRDLPDEATETEVLNAATRGEGDRAAAIANIQAEMRRLEANLRAMEG